MKRYILIFAIILGGISCTDYLEEVPKTQIAIENSFDTYDEAFKNVSSLYANLGNKTGGLITGERFMMPSIIKEGNEESKKFNWNSSTGSISTLWDNYYAYIAQCNIVIQAIEEHKAQIDETFISTVLEPGKMKSSVATDGSFLASEMLLGEIRFLRAYAYFTLYRYYGGIPLIIKPTGASPEFVPRSDREAVFAFIDQEFEYALSKCLTNASGIPKGRITKGAAAGMLAKSCVFHASYIKRAEKYGNKIGETTAGNITELYTKAAKLCDDIIGGIYGVYKLVDYYPAIFTKPNQETLFTVYAVEGVGTGNRIPIGFPGNGNHGALNGPTLTEALAELYDIPTWEYGSRLKTISKTYGQSDILRNDINPVPKDSLCKLVTLRGNACFTGDSIRRLWNTVNATVAGAKDGLANGVWVFDPLYGKALGDGFFIEPGKVNDYTAKENQIIEKLLEPYERLNWRNNTSANIDCWNVNREALGKFRNPNPQSLSGTFDANYSGVAYPILRLAEIYLLKAEIQLVTGKKTEAVNTMNIIRNRACNKSTLRDMFINQGNAIYSYYPNSVDFIPGNLSNDQTFKELIWERLRELCCEDDCEWFDASRYPDIFIEDLDDIARYSDPIRGFGDFFNDPNQGYYGWLGFNQNRINRVLLPIPISELTFFPELKQNPGY